MWDFSNLIAFQCSQKYWDLYDRKMIPIASDPFIPQNVHPNSVGKMGEFYNYKLSDEKPTLDQSVSDVYAEKIDSRILCIC